MTIVVIVVHGAGEEWFPVTQGEKDFLVVSSRIVATVHIDETELSGIATAMEVRFCHGVRVVPTGSGGTRRELIAPPATRRHRRCALFFHTIDVRRDQHTVPMHQFRYIGVVDHVHAYSFA